MSKAFEIKDNIAIKDIKNIIDNNHSISLSAKAKTKINECRVFLEKKIKSSKSPIYGINTGFGALCDTLIDNKDLETLQENLVKSHACGVGKEVPKEIVKLMILLKIQGLSKGYSGIQLQTVERLVEFYNNNITPVIYQQGSLGASGDLSPLAHLSLPLIGLGEVYYENKKQSSGDVLKSLNLKPLKFKSKEALALLNGTQFMSAYAVFNILKAQQLLNWSNIISAISLDAFDCRLDPFNESIHKLRPYKGQQKVAKKINTLLSKSEIAKQKKSQVQDPYSFRCIPQVHGASADVIDNSINIITTEINSVTDNPLVIPESDQIISGGNFHGQPLALMFDSLAIALAELANISERRTYQLISGQRGLPAFLAKKPGLHSGLMIPQYTAASIVSQNKQLCTPSSVDSIVSSNGQEDHVSMGANGATKCFKVVENVERVLAIELFTAIQALEFRKPLKSSSTLETIVKSYRQKVKFVNEDRVLYNDIENSILFIQNSKSEF